MYERMTLDIVEEMTNKEKYFINLQSIRNLPSCKFLNYTL